MHNYMFKYLIKQVFDKYSSTLEYIIQIFEWPPIGKIAAHSAFGLRNVFMV